MFVYVFFHLTTLLILFLKALRVEEQLAQAPPPGIPPPGMPSSGIPSTRIPAPAVSDNPAQVWQQKRLTFQQQGHTQLPGSFFQYYLMLIYYYVKLTKDIYYIVNVFCL